MEHSSPARLFTTLVGGGLVVLGIVGFFYNASFDTGRELRSDAIFGLFAVNGWHNLLHITTGLLGLACAGYAARQYALGMGLAYVIIAIWGFAATGKTQGSLLDLIPVNNGDNLLHLLIGLAGLGAGAATMQQLTRRSTNGGKGSTAAGLLGRLKPVSGAKGAKAGAGKRSKPAAPKKPRP